MIHCPECGKALTGSPRACGYCGASLVNNYFARREPEKMPPNLGAGATAAATLGVFGSFALFAALGFHLLPLFGYGIFPETGVGWWSRTLLLTLLPVIYLVQILVLRGARFSILFDCVWLFLAACGLSVTVQAYLDQGGGAFYEIPAAPYLLVLGCSLVLVASITAVLSYQKA